MFKSPLVQLLFFIIFSTNAHSQGCLFQVSPVLLDLCPGDSACMTTTSGNIPGSVIEQFDFNSSTIPAGWNISGGASFGQPCAPSPTGTDYYWSSASGASTPFVITNPVDVSLGGVITFDLVYAVQGGAAVCEGPDLWSEGVQFQYSVDLGATWVDIAYFNPLGTLSTTPGGSASGQTAFTSWATYCFNVPPAAQTPSTTFRWTQEMSSGANFDNWGLDEVVIANNLSGATVNWSNGAINATSLCASVLTDTTFTAYLLSAIGDTLYQAQTTVNVFNTSQTNDTVTVCSNSDYVFADGTTELNITTTTTHTSIFQDANGCDSTITTTVVPTMSSASVVQVDSSLVSQNTGPNLSYAWIDCNNGFQVIPGEMSPTFVPAQSGSYALVVTENGCSDTSSCFTMNLSSASLSEMNWADVIIYPNPSAGDFTINFHKVYRDFTVRISDAVGNVIFSEFYDFAQSIDIQLEGEAGFYFVEVSTSDQRFIKAVIKELRPF